MTNNNFSSAKEILDAYQLTFKYDKFIDYQNVTKINLHQYFLDKLDFILANRGQADKEFFSSEFIIAPFLFEAWRRHSKVNLFSHPNLKVQDFNLYPDYIIAGKDKTGLKVLQKPLLMTVEAKDEKIEQGWFEALMQMVAARLMNETNDIPIHAIVTTGDFWYFGKLENDTFIRHPTPIGISDTESLISVLNHIFSLCEAYA